jgi:hypothetical protein
MRGPLAYGSGFVSGHASVAMLVLTAAVYAGAQDPLSLPLVQKSDLEYIGSFALPATESGTSRFGYGGHAIIPYTDSLGITTVYMQGHAQQPGQVAQVAVPSMLSKSFDYSKLAVAKLLQPFADVTDGSLSAKLGLDPSDGASVYGLFPYQGKLIVSANEYYGCNQFVTHGISSLDLSLAHDFAGFFQVNGAANPRSIAGPMAEVPASWRALLGGSILTGNWSIPIISCNSPGPALTVFNPEDLGVKSPVPGTTLLFHSLGHALCEGAQCSFPDAEAHTSAIYNLATAFGGIAFPEGTRSVLFFGRQGTGTYCYGTPDACGGDPASDAKGPHAYPYRYQVWAYDAKDLQKVKEGTLKPYEPRPYSVWTVADLDGWVGPGNAGIEGAGYDNKTGRWYITTSYGEKPRVDVFQIKPAGTNLRKRPEKGTSRSHYRIYDIEGRELGDGASGDGASGALGAKAVRTTVGRSGGK